MILLPEFLVEDAIKATFAEVTAEPAENLVDIFGDLDGGRRDHVLAWIKAGGLTEEKMALKQGFPALPTWVPGVYIVLASSDEVQQFVGSDIEELLPVLSGVGPTEERGTLIQTVLRLLVLSPSADTTIYVQAIVRWGLERGRDALEEAGLMSQRLACQDIEPIPELYPDVVFMRGITLTCSHLDTWSEIYPKEYEHVGAGFAD